MFRKQQASNSSIDVLSFPPDDRELDRRRLDELTRGRELERRARLALFFSVGMFVAWAADVGAAFEMEHISGSVIFGVASLPMAFIVVVSHLVGRWALERAREAQANTDRRYQFVRQGDASNLLKLTESNPVVAQYLRLVGRQCRPLRVLERSALENWADDHRH